MSDLLDFQRGGKTVFTSTTFLGYVGCLTCVKPGAFSVSVDTRIWAYSGGLPGELIEQPPLRCDGAQRERRERSRCKLCEQRRRPANVTSTAGIANLVGQGWLQQCCANVDNH